MHYQTLAAGLSDAHPCYPLKGMKMRRTPQRRPCLHLLYLPQLSADR
jgi:hypothetical protein